MALGLVLIASYVTRCGGVITLEDNESLRYLIFNLYSESETW